MPLSLQICIQITYDNGGMEFSTNKFILFSFSILCMCLCAILTEIATVQYEPDEAVKEKKRVTLNAETIPFYLGKLDAIARENNGHLALSKVMISI